MPLPQEITSAGEKARAYATKAGELAVGEVTVGDALRKKIAEVYQDSQDIVKPLDVATSQYTSAPAVAREKYQDIWNPFSREKLVSQYTGTQALPMLSLASILGQRFGRIEDVVGEGTRAYSAQALAAQQAAQQQRLGYTDLLGQYGTEQDLAQQQFENEWAIRQITGGNITLPTGETIYIPSAAERKASSADAVIDWETEFLNFTGVEGALTPPETVPESLVFPEAAPQTRFDYELGPLPMNQMTGLLGPAPSETPAYLSPSYPGGIRI